MWNLFLCCQNTWWHVKSFLFRNWVTFCRKFTDLWIFLSWWISCWRRWSLSSEFNFSRWMPWKFRSTLHTPNRLCLFSRYYWLFTHHLGEVVVTSTSHVQISRHCFNQLIFTGSIGYSLSGWRFNSFLRSVLVSISCKKMKILND